MSFSRQIAQINSVTNGSGSVNGSYNKGSSSNYNRSKETARSKAHKSSRAGRRRSPTPIPVLDQCFDRSRDYDSRTCIRNSEIKVSLNFDEFDKEDFKAKVMSDYHHSRKVSVKQKSRNSRYRLDNRNRNDHDDRDDDDGHGRRAGAKDLSKRIGNREKGKKKHWTDNRIDRRNYQQIDMDEVLYEDAAGSDWMRIKMTIPRSESDRPLLFKDEMMKLFHEKIPNFADKDPHCEFENIMFFIPAASSQDVFRHMLDVVKDSKPDNVPPAKWIKLEKMTARTPISARFEVIPNALQILGEVLGKRYNVPDNSVDLSSFAADTQLNEAGMKMNLKNSEDFALLVRVMKTFPVENISGINLASNMLRNVQQLVPLLEKTPRVTKLNLSGNQLIRNWADLRYIEEWALEDLDIRDTQLAKLVQGRNNLKLSKEARKIFKNLKKFNGRELVASFDLDTSTDKEQKKKPVAQIYDSCLPLNEQLEGPLIKFVTDFISAYDNNREDLFKCYGANAIFTVSVGRGADLSPYRKHQRSIVDHRHLSNSDVEKYRTCHPNTIKKKRLGILACLSELPKTNHDLNSCFLDVTLEVPSIIGFTLTGTFKEPDSGKVRFFSRHILASFTDNSFVINHDQLFVRDSSYSERDNHGKKQDVLPNPRGGAAAEPPADKDAMVKKFMDNSGMVENYSKMCLEQNDWNFNRAAEKFMELKNGGQLPADAWQPGRAP